MSDGFTNISKFNFEQTDEQKILLEQVDRVCRGVRPSEDQCYLEHRPNVDVRKMF